MKLNLTSKAEELYKPEMVFTYTMRTSYPLTYICELDGAEPRTTEELISFIERLAVKTDAAQANVEAPTIDANRSEVGEEPNDTERGSRVAYEFLLGDLHLGEDALNPWKVPGKPLAAHRIVLARFDGGWPDWRLYA